MIDVIGYELCPYPPALFESTILTLEADKPALATALRQVTGKVSPDSDSTTAQILPIIMSWMAVPCSVVSSG